MQPPAPVPSEQDAGAGAASDGTGEAVSRLGDRLATWFT
jgi:hypothetical protein